MGAIDYAWVNRVALAFLDIYLTTYSEYAFDVWSTGASGFMLKPITAEEVWEQLKNLKCPFSLGGKGENE